jgi:large subunit ribosomal protein L30
MTERKQKSAAAKTLGRMLRVTQVRSAIGGTRRQRECLRGLGLKRLGCSAIVPDSPATRGMIQRVGHLLAVEE